MAAEATTGDSGASIDTQRRQLLKAAGAAAAITSIGLNSAATAAPVGAGRDETDVYDVVIVGAGLAGLTAARDLRRAGCESFLVLEARDRVGGRTLNHDLGGGQISEAGGQWIGPGQTAVADLARELDVGTFPTYYEGKTVILGGNGRAEVDLKGSFGTDEAIGAKLSALSRDVPSGAPWKSPRVSELDISMGQWLGKQDIKPEDRIGWNSSVLLSGGAVPAKMGFLHFLSMINSADCDYSQLDGIKHSAQETRLVGGSQILSIKLAQELGNKVRLSCPVRRVANWGEDIVTLRTDQGEFRARQVVMAMHPALCNQLQFDPVLPPARRALQRAWPAYTPGRKTAMVYSRPFWRERGFSGGIYQFGGPIVWAYDNSPPRGDIGVINAFVAHALVPSDLKAAQRLQCDLYTRAWGAEASNPLSYHDHDWGRADPWTLTCISAIPPGFWPTHGPALRPPCGNLIWSGTETADIWAGYMDGAVRSGHRAALQALNALRQS